MIQNSPAATGVGSQGWREAEEVGTVGRCSHRRPRKVPEVQKQIDPSLGLQSRKESPRTARRVRHERRVNASRFVVVRT